MSAHSRAPGNSICAPVGAPHVGVTCGAFDLGVSISLLPNRIDGVQCGVGAPHVGVTCGAFDFWVSPSHYYQTGSMGTSVAWVPHTSGLRVGLLISGGLHLITTKPDRCGPAWLLPSHRTTNCSSANPWDAPRAFS